MLRVIPEVRAAVIAAFIMVSFGGCSSTREASPLTAAPPDWMQGAIIWSDKVCAVGASEPTYYIDDARAVAADNCRSQLAHTLSTQITSVMIDTATERYNTVEEATVTQTTASITDKVVENAEVVDYWLDARGQASDRKNITYALCCMPKGQ
jgi:hypothetical protein